MTQLVRPQGNCGTGDPAGGQKGSIVLTVFLNASAVVDTAGMCARIGTSCYRSCSLQLW